MDNTSIDDMTNLILDSSTELQDFDERSKTSSTTPELSEKEKMELENFDAQLEVSSEINPGLANFDNQLEQIEDNSSNNQLIAEGINNFLNLLQTDHYETKNYILEREDGEISINTKDDRGEVFHQDAQGNIESKFTQDETENFVDFSEQVQEKSNDLEGNNETNKALELENDYEQSENKLIADGVDNFLTMQESERYETANYILEKSENGEISISARDGDNENKLFTVDEGGTITNQLSAEQTEDFVTFAEKVNEAANKKILEAVDNFLDLQESDYHGTTNYFFERTSDGDISITSKSSGEEVFQGSADGNIVEENLSPEETKKFLEFANTVEQAVEQKEYTASQKER
ncbi:MAG: hypothetical protein F6K23_38435 [Okeania sp. SIO2C9]|uniref:hypothetical protein n=1 Tax=Okeania sp. SIO2C9 TaxID=2607791 RepID=UPI0013C18E8F|nr:hypothetical protein [Okeania sp. SIO2C9]NEQ78355.1 hypothetical protein [Okeania sp. SIO2C9]